MEKLRKLKELKELKKLKESRQSEINGMAPHLATRVGAHEGNGNQKELNKLEKSKQSEIKVDSDVDVINLRALAGPPKIRKPL